MKIPTNRPLERMFMMLPIMPVAIEATESWAYWIADWVRSAFR